MPACDQHAPGLKTMNVTPLKSFALCGNHLSISCKVNLLNCVDGREPNTLTIICVAFVTLCHCNMYVATTDANRP